MEIQDFGIKIIRYTNESPLFKGPALVILGLVALWFVWNVTVNKNKKIEKGSLVCAILAIFIILYGLFITIIRPMWWNPPY